MIPSLPVVRAEAIESGVDRFECTPLRATMRASTCVARQRKAAAGVFIDSNERNNFSRCVSCALGAVVHVRVTGEPAPSPPEGRRTLSGEPRAWSSRAMPHAPTGATDTEQRPMIDPNENEATVFVATLDAPAPAFVASAMDSDPAFVTRACSEDSR